MAKRSTRNKIRHQAKEAKIDLERAMIHMTQLAAIADDRSPVIDESLPQIMGGLQAVIDTWDTFMTKL